MEYQMKEGDVFEYRGCGKWPTFNSFTIGRKYTIRKNTSGLYIITDEGYTFVFTGTFPEDYGFQLVKTPRPDKRMNATNTQESKMVKVGDRVKLVKRDGAWCSANVGKEGTVIGYRTDFHVNVLFDNSEGEIYEGDWGNPDHLELISTTSTYSIPADTETVTLKYADGSTQNIDVKDRARGVPEWLKDGAWVVNKDSGKTYKIVRGARTWYVQDGKESTFETYVWDIDIVHNYRPFTNSDWKWGMWAEYRGEKVFVCSGKLPFDLIRIDANPDGKVYPTLGSNGYVNISMLTPTTAP